MTIPIRTKALPTIIIAIRTSVPGSMTIVVPRGSIYWPTGIAIDIGKLVARLATRDWLRSNRMFVTTDAACE